MKKLALIALAMLLVGGLSLAQTGERTGTSATLELGYFFPGGSVFRQVYASGPSFGADVAVPVRPLLRAWAGIELFSRTGELPVSEEPSRVSVVPLFAGLRAQLDRHKLRPYFGLAAAYFLVHEKNALGSAGEGGLGLIGQAGIQTRLRGAFRLDAHAGFRACSVHAGGDDRLSANVGGFSLGLGLAYYF